MANDGFKGFFVMLSLSFIMFFGNIMEVWSIPALWVLAPLWLPYALFFGFISVFFVIVFIVLGVMVSVELFDKIRYKR